MFFLNQNRRKICTCGLKTKAENQDSNLFAETVYMEELVRKLDESIKSGPEARAIRKDI